MKDKNHEIVKVAEYAVIIKDRRVLMMQWSKVNNYSWHFPGGRIDKGEQSIEAMKREVKEEIGLEVEVIRPIYTKMYNAKNNNTYRVFFLCKLKSDSSSENIKLEDGFIDYKWFLESEVSGLKFFMPFYDDVLRIAFSKIY